MNRRLFSAILTAACAFVLPEAGTADDLEPLSSDTNGDGAVRVLSFGDSLTFGVGDGDITAESTVKGGYPNRTETLLGIPFDNAGLPGEELTTAGAARLLDLARVNPDDYIIIMEGANDAFRSVSSAVYRASLQRAVNAARVLGKLPVLMTLPIPCCNHGAQVLSTVRYSSQIQTVALANDLPLVDIEKAWQTTCGTAAECELYNVPEGLHPNAKGYDVMSQTVAARFVGIDIFAPGGASNLEQALGLPAGTVIVKPEASPAP